MLHGQFTVEIDEREIKPIYGFDNSISFNLETTSTFYMHVTDDILKFCETLRYKTEIQKYFEVELSSKLIKGRFGLISAEWDERDGILELKIGRKI